STPGESIWEFLHHRDGELQDAAGATLIPLLIFDQFEELFTLAQSDELGRARGARFIEELGDLVENRAPKALEDRLDADESLPERFDFGRSDYRVVIALREDYLAPLESLKKVMPSLAQNRLRLAPMTGTQALEAVLQPGNRLRPGKPLVSQEVAEAIVRFVAGGSELAHAEVEPSLLSLICRELNEQRIARGNAEISQDLLAGSHETILSTFYERSLADQPEAVRRIIEDDLLTESGYRENLSEESLLRRFQTAGAGADALATLVNRRLLRIEERLDVRRVELTHDVLTGVVRASRDARHEREAQAAAERALIAQRAREEAAHRALRRTRAIAAGCTALAAVAVVAAVFAFSGFKRARHAELLAQQTRAVSEQAREQAEGLLGFLTDRFVSELETFGRQKTVAELSEREIDYFQHLPPSLQDPETVRSGALALLNYGNAASQLGYASSARQSLDRAIALLERLRRTDRSDATAVALGNTYSWRCFSVGGAVGFRGPEIRRDCERAVDLLRPVAKRKGASTDALRAYLHALAWLELVDLTHNRTSDLVREGREAIKVGRQLDIPHEGDQRTDASFASAETYLAVALVRQGHAEEARQAGVDALGVFNQILARDPHLPIALGSKVMDIAGLTTVAAEELNPAEGLRVARQGEQAALTLVGIEPRNALYQNDVGEADQGIAGELWAAGRLREAIEYGKRDIAAYGRAVAGNGLAVLFSVRQMNRIASWQAQVGDFPGAAATAATGDAFLTPAALSKLGFSPGHDSVDIGAARSYAAAAIAYERGDFGGALRMARGALATLGVRRPREGIELTWTTDMLCTHSDIAGRAAYALSDFAAAAQEETSAVSACQASGNSTGNRRAAGKRAIWLSMALAREGKGAEAARTIGPVVTMYRELEGRNRGDRWLPLEFAEALYAQSLSDPRHRTALLREADGLIDHLAPTIAGLHDTRVWHARIESEAR
ncbi:MAG: hypothetical protein ACREUG_13495, partial [Steroidobacteraceae bacterium]